MYKRQVVEEQAGGHLGPDFPTAAERDPVEGRADYADLMAVRCLFYRKAKCRVQGSLEWDG